LRRFGGALLFGVVLVLVGCQGKPTGTVSGKVTHKGKPVTTGSVNLYWPEKGLGHIAKLSDSGAFTISEPVEVGTYKFYVQPPPPEQLPPGQVSKAPTLAIPKKYQDGSTTDKTVEVKAGPNDLTIDFPD
jgi:hypothetical protein